LEDWNDEVEFGSFESNREVLEADKSHEIRNFEIGGGEEGGNFDFTPSSQFCLRFLSRTDLKKNFSLKSSESWKLSCAKLFLQSQISRFESFSPTTPIIDW
jgi:hypothetical protein